MVRARQSGKRFACSFCLSRMPEPSTTNRASVLPGGVPAQGKRPTLVGAGPAMERLRGVLGAVARRDCTVMIEGESGSGKELAARTIHAMSSRQGGAFVAVDCTGLRDTLLESQLFGHVKGAFTGAESAALGFIRSADGGTLFLDEIGELEIKTQAKLLRVIQERAVVPLGATRPIPVDIRVVCASHRDLRAMAGRGEFREDLLFRLDVVKVGLPALRERVEDIGALAGHFLGQLAELYGEPACVLSAGAMDALCAYRWPGNVRELANAVEHAVVFSRGGLIEVGDLPERVRAGAFAVGDGGAIGVQTAGVGVPTLAQMEKELICRALRVAMGNQNRAAAILDIERRRLYRKITLHGLRGLVDKRSAGDAV